MREVISVCDECGDSFKGLVNHDTCVPCLEGEKPQETKTTYYKYHGKRFKKNRDKVLERDGYECVSCGVTQKEHQRRDDLFGDGLHVHHITPAREIDDVEKRHKLNNLITLCDLCHKEVERGVKDIPE